MKFLLMASLFFTNILQAQSSLAFKKELISNTHWLVYVLALGVLFVVLFFLAKKSRHLTKTKSKCEIIEKIPIHHKTQIYIIAYDGQRVLIADNQNALAIHPLQEATPPRSEQKPQTTIQDPLIRPTGTFSPCLGRRENDGSYLEVSSHL